MATMASLAISISVPIQFSISSYSSSATSKLTTQLPYPLLHHNTLSIGFSTSISQLGSSWNGFRFATITVPKQFTSKERRSRRCRGNVVYASLFGVGAPEALVIGVVALLVFGPKGLAEVARNLGKTLRAFQPTIRELKDVSREFKSTLEREIGLDDIANPVQNTYTPPTTQTLTSVPSPAASSDPPQTPVEFNGLPSPSQAYTSEEYLKVTEGQLKAAAAAAWQQEQVSSTAEDKIVSQKMQSESLNSQSLHFSFPHFENDTLTTTSGTVQESTSTVPPPSPAKLKGDSS